MVLYIWKLVLISKVKNLKQNILHLLEVMKSLFQVHTMYQSSVLVKLHLGICVLHCHQHVALLKLLLHSTFM